MEAQQWVNRGPPGAPRWRTFIELGTRAGPRFEELTGLHGHHVDWLRSRAAVAEVMTRNGLRQYPKSRKSHRVVPVPVDTLEGMSALMAGRPCEALVFTVPEGGAVSDGTFRNRAWYPAAAAARLYSKIAPHLGYESFATTQRYAHLAPDAHSRVVEVVLAERAVDGDGPASDVGGERAVELLSCT